MGWHTLALPGAVGEVVGAYSEALAGFLCEFVGGVAVFVGALGCHFWGWCDVGVCGLNEARSTIDDTWSWWWRDFFARRFAISALSGLGSLGGEAIKGGSSCAMER